LHQPGIADVFEKQCHDAIVANLPLIAVGTVHRVFRQPADPGHFV